MARTADVILMMLDAIKGDVQRWGGGRLGKMRCVPVLTFLENGGKKPNDSLISVLQMLVLT